MGADVFRLLIRHASHMPFEDSDIAHHVLCRVLVAAPGGNEEAVFSPFDTWHGLAAHGQAAACHGVQDSGGQFVLSIMPFTPFS